MRAHRSIVAGLRRAVAPAAAVIGLAVVVAATAPPAAAQPSTAATAVPPARAGVALRGAILQNRHVDGGHAACFAACRDTATCSGWNHATAAFGGAPGRTMPNCTLLAGALTDEPVKDVVSCRMPCDPKTAAAPAQLPPRTTTATLGPPVATPNPGAGAPPLLVPAGPKSPTATLDPSRPPIVVGGLTAGPLPTAPAPAPAPAPATRPPAPAPAPAPATAAAAVPKPIGGYEVVFGPDVSVAPLAWVVAGAQCPNGKVALSAGYRFLAGSETFGLEVRGAIPDDRSVRVHLRNANVLAVATGRAFAVCVDAIAGLRRVEVAWSSDRDTATPGTMVCGAGERVVGGGAMGSNDTMIGSNSPRVGGASGSFWEATAQLSTPMPGRGNVPVVALCAPAASVDGWEIVETAPVKLGARSQATLRQACPAGKVLLSGGLRQSGGTVIDLVTDVLAPDASGSSNWSAHLHNRNVIGGSGPVVASFAAVCAKRT